MKYSRLLQFFLLLHTPSASCEPCHPSASEVDVAIIGGGSSGIHAAIQLQDAGASVLVIEKKAQIGGHAETYTDTATDIPANVGVIIFENTNVVKNYFARLQVNTTNVPFPINLLKARAYDFSLGIRIPAPNATALAAERKAVLDAIEVYEQSVLTKYPWIDDGYLIPDPVPEELAWPFGEFARHYNFTAALPITSQLGWYIGNISNVPALYGIKNFGPGIVNSIKKDFLAPSSGDTRTLYHAAAAELKHNVLLNSTITHVQRENEDGCSSSHSVSLVVQQSNHEPRFIRARKLLISIPPTLENLKVIGLAREELSLLSKFSARGYWAGVVQVPGLNYSLQNIGALNPYREPEIPGNNGYTATGTPNQFLLGVGFDNDRYNDADAEAVVRRELTTLASLGVVPSSAAQQVTFPYTSNHAPFNVRVSNQEIISGFYKKLLSLAGTRNTYWTGAAFNGQNSGLVWTWNEQSVVPRLKKDLNL